MATARNAINQTRRAIITAMQAEPSITSLVPAARIYPPRVATAPTWPYIRHGVGISTPIKGTCLNGASVVAAINVFGKGGDEVAGHIGDVVADFLDGPNGNGLSLRMQDGRWATVQVESVNILQDGTEADNFRVIISTRTTVSGG